MKYSLDRKRIDNLPKELVLKELQRVAAHYNYRRFSRYDFDAVAQGCKGSTVINKFGSWQKALDAIGFKLKPYKADRRQISDEALLKELGRIWSNLGHRPSKTEWGLSDAKYAYGTYKYRFDSWLNACARYIEYVSGDSHDEDERIQNSVPEAKGSGAGSIPTEDKRYIPLKLRLNVFQHDSFKCVLCGKSPATHLGTVLHIDHIIPFSKGGKTILKNLQTLCEECNWGKGNDESV